jgi:hypothetical protein
MIDVQTPLINGTLLNPTSSILFHLLLYADISIGIIVTSSFLLTRILKKIF